MSDAVRSIVVAVALCVLLLLVAAAGLVVFTGQTEARTNFGSRQLVVRSSLLRGIGIQDGSPTTKPAQVNLGGQTVLVSEAEIDVVNVRKIALPADCQKIEIVQTQARVQVLLDGIEAR